MASLNTLTGLIGDIEAALDTVAREKIGATRAVSLDASAEFAAVNQPIRSHVAPAVSTVSITPGSSAPDSGGQAVGYVDLVITKNKMVPIQWTGDEQLSVRGRVTNILQDQFAQAFRALSNEVSADIAAAAKAGASRAFGSPGTAPFNTANDLSDIANMARILDDNGAPDSDRHAVYNGAAWLNLRAKQGLIQKVNESGSDEMLRRGVITDLEGFGMHQDRYVVAPTAVGTGANYVIDGTGNTAAGSTVLKLKTGTGTILAGDVITIGNFKYMVKTALTSTLVEINAPGLMAAVTDGDTVTVNAAFTSNYAFHRSALVLATRLPAMPVGGDGADDVVSVVDPVSGITYQIALYRGYRQVHMEVGLAWGVKAIKPEFIAINQG